MPARGVCERRPALLVPGYTGSKEDFLAVLQPLAAAGRRVVAIDLRGQYETPGPDSAAAYAPDALAADIIAVAAAVGQDEREVHLVGHSLGGLLARQAVLSAGAAFRSLTLLGSGPAGLTGARADAVRALLDQLAAAGPDSLPQRVAQLWDEQLGPEATAAGVPMPIVGFLRERMTRTAAAGLLAMGQYLLSAPDRTFALAELGQAPVLVLYGENDDAWPPAVQDRMAKRLGAQRVCLPAAAHSPAVDAPETTASTLSSFWNAVESAGRRRRSGQEPAGDPGAPAGRSDGGAGAGGGTGLDGGAGLNSSGSPSQGRR
jgi:pimeloyl-ACP methyl ester carboxylesterase